MLVNNHQFEKCGCRESGESWRCEAARKAKTEVHLEIHSLDIWRLYEHAFFLHPSLAWPPSNVRLKKGRALVIFAVRRIKKWALLRANLQPNWGGHWNFSEGFSTYLTYLICSRVGDAGQSFSTCETGTNWIVSRSWSLMRCTLETWIGRPCWIGSVSECGDSVRR
jgi:hypothetical protein